MMITNELKKDSNKEYHGWAILSAIGDFLEGKSINLLIVL